MSWKNYERIIFIHMIHYLLRSAFHYAFLFDSYNEARRLKRGLDFSYTKIHACPNDYVLLWKDNIDKDEYP